MNIQKLTVYWRESAQFVNATGVRIPDVSAAGCITTSLIDVGAAGIVRQ
jgi:hypothetical protein